MPTRKQRRRRLKEQRHEWEEVYVDAEGRELAPEEVEELVPERPARNGRTTQKPAGRSAQAKGATARAERGVKPPSWKRVFKRAAIFAPLMYLFIAVTSDDLSPAQGVLTTVWLLIVFIPFSYLMDSLTHRIWKKRADRGAAAGAKKRP